MADVESVVGAEWPPAELVSQAAALPTAELVDAVVPTLDFPQDNTERGIGVRLGISHLIGGPTPDWYRRVDGLTPAAQQEHTTYLATRDARLRAVAERIAQAWGLLPASPAAATEREDHGE
jgi:hypothetical protein